MLTSLTESKFSRLKLGLDNIKLVRVRAPNSPTIAASVSLCERSLSSMALTETSDSILLSNLVGLLLDYITSNSDEDSITPIETSLSVRSLGMGKSDLN